MNEPKILTSLGLGTQCLLTKNPRKSDKTKALVFWFSRLRPKLPHHHHLGFSDLRPFNHHRGASWRHAFCPPNVEHGTFVIRVVETSSSECRTFVIEVLGTSSLRSSDLPWTVVHYAASLPIRRPDAAKLRNGLRPSYSTFF